MKMYLVSTVIVSSEGRKKVIKRDYTDVAIHGEHTMTRKNREGKVI